ncbi:MAG TPA: hypothetical protein VLV89_07060 [Candidatus Acidoferrum sp.]|nr:hypothetical protein [Candidatus Acidoferrum sp.]
MSPKLALLAAAIVASAGFSSGLAWAHLHVQSSTHAVFAARAVDAAEPLAHVRSEFHFTLHAPMAVAAPLFGPEGERAWGGSDWDPAFLFPQPAKDVEGAVFLVHHGQHKSTWVTTALDFTAGHVQYVNLIDGAMVTRIDIHLAATGHGDTEATIVYERTALQPELNEHVISLAQEDTGMGAHWESAINSYLRSIPQSK